MGPLSEVLRCLLDRKITWNREGLEVHATCLGQLRPCPGSFQSDATGLPILHGSKNKPTRGHFWSYTDGTQVVMKATLDAPELPILRTF